jgi:hypothetical protein
MAFSETTAFDWTPYLKGGGTRPDAITGMQDPFEAALQSMFMAAPPEIRSQLKISSGYRSPEVQARLWEEAAAKYPDPAERRKWVAPPYKSQHNHGYAADLSYASDDARNWVHANLDSFGLVAPMSYEPWHVELKGARSGDVHTTSEQPGPTLAAAAPSSADAPPSGFGTAMTSTETDQARMARRPKVNLAAAFMAEPIHPTPVGYLQPSQPAPLVTTSSVLARRMSARG